MEWSRLLDVAPRAGCCKAIRDQAVALNERIAKLRDYRAKLDAEKRPDAELGTDELLETAPQQNTCNDENTYMLLQTELKLRTDLAVFYQEYHVELKRLREKAFQAHEKAQADVRARLTEIGYHDVSVTVVDPCKITPGMIMSHPDVLDAKNNHAELANMSSSHDHANLNAEAIGEVRRVLNHFVKHSRFP